MLKKIKTPLNQLKEFDDPDMSRLALQIQLINEAIQNIQESAFIFEAPLYSNSDAVVDRLLFKDNANTGVTSVKSNFVNPQPVGVGRQRVRDNAVISTLIHTSPNVEAGQVYRFDEGDGAMKVRTDPTLPAQLVGLADGWGFLIRGNLV